MPDFGRGVGTDFDALARGIGNERENAGNAGVTTLEGGGVRKGVHQMRLEVAGVAEVDGSELFTALVKSEQFKICGGVVEPGHALGGGAPCARGDDNFEAAEVAARVRVLAAVVEPENAEGENAIDDGGGFRCAHANYGMGRGSLEQASADVGGTEAVLEIHGGAQAVDLRAQEMPCEHAIEEALIVAARGVAGSGSAAVAGGNKIEELRPGRAHLARGQTQRLRAWLHSDDSAHEVALLAPKLEQAAAMGLGDGVARGAHVEEHAAIFKHSRAGVRGQIRFDDPGQLRGGGDGGFFCSGFLSRRGAGAHGVPLPRHALAQVGDVGGVMKRVPGVDGESGGKVETAALGMNHAAGEVCFAHVLEKRHPTGVQCVDEDEGAVDREACCQAVGPRHSRRKA